MKCAFELKEIADEVNKERKIAWETIVFANTINFCENTLAPLLEEEAKKGFEYCSLPFNVQWQGYYRLLKRHISYAGYEYFTYNSDVREIDFNILRDYLKSFCIEVHVKEDKIPTSNHNFYIDGCYLIFSFENPNCLSDN